jgi:streptomycin 6-kinase
MNMLTSGQQASTYLDLWKLETDGPCFETHSSLLWPVLYEGRKVMLKIVREGDDEANGADILQLFDGHGAIRLLRHEQTAMLLERVVSPVGQPSLEQMVLSGHDDEATHIICDVIEQIHGHIKGKPTPSSHTLFADRIAETQGYMNEGRVAKEDMPLFEEGVRLSQDLLRLTTSSHMLLHGDLHHFNVMCSTQRGWLAIDPKGIVGPRVYEYVIALCNPTLHILIVANLQRMGRQASIMAERSGVDRQLILQFTFIHALQVAAWCLSPPDKAYWLACAKTAKELI